MNKLMFSYHEDRVDEIGKEIVETFGELALAFRAGKSDTAEYKEKKQLCYIMDYAKAHNIKISKIMHRGVLGVHPANKQFDMIVKSISEKEVDGVLIANMGSISTSIADAYNKVAKVISAGGQIITVDEGNLILNIKKLGGIA